MIIACRKINKDAINVLLNAGTDPNITDINGDACLHCAAKNDCCTEILEAIISYGGDVNATGFHNKTALMIACRKRNKDAINVLLNAGADPNIPDIDDYTCLHCAVKNDCCTEILQAMISHGGDVNAAAFHNKTALMIACRKRNKDAINVLLNAGTDPNITDINGDTCLHCAAENGCCSEVLQEIVIHGGDVNATGFHNNTALMIACRKMKKDAIDVLLNAGADPNITDSSGNKCLHCAAENGCCSEVLQAIVIHGGDVNATGFHNRTALMIACRHMKKDAINVLLNAGTNPNITNSDGDTCLHCAVKNDCCAEVLQAIISHGGDVNATGFCNKTALMVACRYRNKDAISVLLNAGADRNIAGALRFAQIVPGDTCLHCTARNDCCSEVLQAIIIIIMILIMTIIIYCLYSATNT